MVAEKDEDYLLVYLNNQSVVSVTN